MKFIKFFRYDLRCGILKSYYKYIILLILVTLAFLEFRGAVTSFENYNFSFGDSLLFIYGGVKETQVGADTFLIPHLWLLNHLLILYFTLNFMRRDLEHFGQQTIYRSGSRYLWWCSKCLWQVVSVACFYLFSGAFLLVLTAVTSGNLSTQISDFMPFIMNIGEKAKEVLDLNLQLEIMLMPMLMSIAVGLLQMTLCLFIKPIFSFIVSVVALISSAYYLNPFFVGNYAMAIRSEKLVSNGVDATVGVVFLVIIAVFSLLVGLLRFRKYDILAKG